MATPNKTTTVPAAGSPVTDTMGRTGIAAFNPNTGEKLGTYPAEMAANARATGGYTGAAVNTLFGSSAIPGIGKSQSDAMGNAYGAITNGAPIPVPAYGSKNADGSVNKFDPNTGKALTDPNAPAATVKSTDPNTGIITMSDGTTQQPDANTAAIYSQRNASQAQTNAEYSTSLSSMEADASANISVLEQQKSDALSALKEEMAVGSPDSGENTTLNASVANLTAKYDQAIQSARAQLQAGKANLLNQKNAALASIQTQFDNNLANLPVQQLQQQQLQASVQKIQMDNIDSMINNAYPEIQKAVITDPKTGQTSFDMNKVSLSAAKPIIEAAMKTGKSYDEAVQLLEQGTMKARITDLNEQSKVLSDQLKIKADARSEENTNRLNTLAQATLNKEDKGTQADRTAATVSNFSSAFVPGASLPNGNPVIDTNGYITSEAWKEAIKDAPAEGLTRKQFINEFGYLMYQDDNGNISKDYGLTEVEKKIITGALSSQ